MKIGAILKENGESEFRVWGPLLNRLDLKITFPEEKLVPMTKDSEGYFNLLLENIKPGTRYLYSIDGRKDRPDPASYFQPEGVHGPSEVIDHGYFKWKDGKWKGVTTSEMIIYEIHTGTFSKEGTFKAIEARLDELVDLGINTIEIMPVSQFPGGRNWGYDGTYHFAVQNTYGSPDSFKSLINECHLKGISVILDVVYNHLGPEGNYLGEFAPYFTDKYKTPWGKAINYDDAHSQGVRNYFIQNVLFWFENYHIDALRLDAIHGIFDFGAKHILEELSENTAELSKRLGRKFFLIAESDLNDTRIVRPKEQGGYEIDAQWCDDFHHSLHTLITGEKQGYYEDFGSISCLAKAYREGFVYSWDYSKHRKRYFGNSSADILPDKLVAFIQNHDQIGNRAGSERLSTLTDFEGLKLAAGATILSPYIPLIFMGEEYGEDNPFYYFISHGDENLIEAVRKGRKEEFKAFNWKCEPPDPYSEETFIKSKINRKKIKSDRNKIIYDFYKTLLALRKFSHFNAAGERNVQTKEFESHKILAIKRFQKGIHSVIFMNFSTKEDNIEFDFERIHYKKVLDSSDEKWSGSGATSPDRAHGLGKIALKPHCFVLYCSGGPE